MLPTKGFLSILGWGLPLFPYRKWDAPLSLGQRLCVRAASGLLMSSFCHLCWSHTFGCLHNDYATTSIYCEWWQGMGMGDSYTANNSLIYRILVSCPFYRGVKLSLSIISKWQSCSSNLSLKSTSVLLLKSLWAVPTIILASENQVPYSMRVE